MLSIILITLLIVALTVTPAKMRQLESFQDSKHLGKGSITKQYSTKF